MDRISKAFEVPAFVAYMVAGDPDYETSLQVAKAIIDGGADVLELGFPFTDPVADGPVIQKADIRALSSGITMVAFTYANPVIRMGLEHFCECVREAGMDAVLIVDMPLEEAEEALSAAKKNDLHQIFLISQTTSQERLVHIAEHGSGFLYLVSSMGITGQRDEVSEEAIDLIARVNAVTDLPLAVGFGISKPSHARKLLVAGADGVIVGSAIVSLVERNLQNSGLMAEEIREFVSSMKNGMR
jgi:tryptophan synthase alpha chain